jgi:hypothetical protein
MPIVSKAQQRFMYANEFVPGQTGVVAREFIANTPASAYKNLPERATPAPRHDFRVSVLNNIMKQMNQE